MESLQQQKRGKESADAQEGGRNKILIIGDWIVDDNWVVGIHRSPTAARTGPVYYRSLKDHHSIVQAFCGAGQTAYLLYHTRYDDRYLFDVIGLGVWDHKDTEILKEMFRSDGTYSLTPLRLFRPNPNEGIERIDLINICEKLNRPEGTYGTTRVLRVYQQSGTKINHLFRLDWELLPSSINSRGEPEWIVTQEELGSLKKVLKNNLDVSADVSAVVIKDLCKGVVTDKIVELLAKHFKKNNQGKRIPWFVSTKAWKPSWLSKLKEVDVWLLVVPQIAAQTAVHKSHKGLSCWLSKSGCPSREALEILKELRDTLLKSKNLRIVVLPDDHQTIALAASPKKNQQHDNSQQHLIVQPIREFEHHEVAVRMASAYYAALIANLLSNQNSMPPFENLLGLALSDTRRLQDCDIKRLIHINSGMLEEEPQVTVFTEDMVSSAVTMTNHAFYRVSFNVADREWNEASKNIGVIEEKSGCRLELWRVMTEVDGYVCFAPPKRKTIARLVRGVQAFINKDPRQHVSCNLIADPGSGKTYLVDRLARSLGFNFLEFNITQLLSRGEIIDCFDTIVTTQAQSGGTPLLVFVDEIDAAMGGQHVYDVFLSPLERNRYRRAGKTFYIDPCVWIFAGTHTDETKLKNSSTSKWRDLCSRLTLGSFNLIEAMDKKALRTEKVYLGAAITLDMFPDVHRISKGVLWLFYSMNPKVSVRTLKHFISSFEYVQRGMVIERNLPNIENFEIEITKKVERSDDHEVLVEIVS